MEASTRDIRFYLALRRKMLRSLYASFREHPYAPVAMAELREACGVPPEDLNWNLVYLEKCGYVELGRAYEGSTYVASSAEIASAGIDLVEDEAAFGRKFPPEREHPTALPPPAEGSDPRCPFCPQQAGPRVKEAFRSVLALEDVYPVTEGHLLIVPVRHTRDYFTMTEGERRDAEHLLEILRKRIEQEDPEVSGFNIGANCGASAGQTIHHAHIHLIPRRDGDTENPRGGVRGVIPGRRSYGPEPDA